jgi:hypothetical protein
MLICFSIVHKRDSFFVYGMMVFESDVCVAALPTLHKMCPGVRFKSRIGA